MFHGVEREETDWARHRPIWMSESKEGAIVILMYSAIVC